MIKNICNKKISINYQLLNNCIIQYQLIENKLAENKLLENKLLENKLIKNKKLLNNIKCDKCKGTGWIINIFKVQNINEYDICKKCLGKGYL